MTRTNIEIDDVLVGKAMRMYGLPSKRAAIQFALERLVGDPMTKVEALAMQGSGFDLTNDEIEGTIDPRLLES
ncbi:MAG TPA: type II toxin-antitoxin system VapB family antitoxin [Acidimicrobiales bacterium]